MKTNAQVTLGVTTGKGRGPAVVTLTIEDWVSGETIVEGEFTGDEWWEVLSASNRRAEVYVTEHPERIGKKVEVTVVPVPPSETDGVSDREIQKEFAQRWAALHAAGSDAPWAGDGGPEEWWVRNTNHGWEAVYRRWVAA